VLGQHDSLVLGFWIGRRVEVRETKDQIGSFSSWEDLNQRAREWWKGMWR
jgi:hypothetical protein